jgi:hypothetical protein
MPSNPKGTAMNLRRTSAAILGSLLLGASLFAQAPAPTTVTPKREAHMDKRADRQQQRIAKGVASGQLTAKETAKVERKEAKIDRDMAKAKADGVITKQEARKIQKEQNSASREIKRKKHNAKVAQ